MKKKFVNVVLSAAVVTSMMFGMTACGSKDTTPAPAEDAAVTNTVAADTEPAADESTVADAETTADESTVADDASAGNGSIEDWINSDKASTYVTLFDTMFGGQMTTAFEADGDTLVLAVILSDDVVGLDGDSLSDDDLAEMQAAMQQQYDSSADQFEPIRDELRNEVGNDSMTVRMSYRLSDGTELFAQDL